MNIFGHNLRFRETEGMVARRENSVNEGESVGIARGLPGYCPQLTVPVGVDQDTRASHHR